MTYEAARVTIKSAIPGVCGPQKSKIQRAEKYADSVGDITEMLEGLNKICGGIFFEKASLNVDISQDSSDDVVEAYKGKKPKPSPSPSPSPSPPSNAALAQKVGDTPLTTEADDLSNGVNELDGEIGALSSLSTTSKSSLVAAINEVDVDVGVLSSLTTSSKTNIVGAINELDLEIGDLSLLSTSQNENLVVAINEAASSGGSSVYVPIGTLGSFYSCSDLAGTSRTLIASGKNTVAEMASEQQKCRAWARDEKLNKMGGSSIIIDGATAHTYVSSSSVGGCYDVIGSLVTQQTSAGRHHSGPESFVTNYRSIPSIKINCIDEECKTEQTSIGGDDNFHFLIPELTVSCSNGSCSVNAVAISYFQPLKIFSQIVTCDSFPCSVAGYSSVPAREISCVGDVCSSNEVLVASSSEYFVAPAQVATCSSSVCILPEATIMSMYIDIPSRSTTCADYVCTDLEALSLTDSIGNAVSIPTMSISCSDFNDLCYAERKQITVSSSLGSYQYNFANQFISCVEGACSSKEYILYAATVARDYLAVPSLTVVSVAATAGSLSALCMDELDN